MRVEFVHLKVPYDTINISNLYDSEATGTSDLGTVFKPWAECV